MDVSKILTELRHERAQIDEAILSLERLLHGRSQRRGRPPAWLNEVTGAVPAKRRGRPRSVAAPAMDSAKQTEP